jgi:hypothetical protein
MTMPRYGDGDPAWCPLEHPWKGVRFHDWRLYARTDPYFVSTADNPKLEARQETWFCTRCRKIDERVVTDGSQPAA